MLSVDPDFEQVTLLGSEKDSQSSPGPELAVRQLEVTVEPLKIVALSRGSGPLLGVGGRLTG